MLTAANHAALAKGDARATTASRATPTPMTARSLALFVAAAIAEIGGAYLIWLAQREHKSPWLILLGGLALAGYGVIATFQPSNQFGRVLAAYGGVFVVGSLLWAVAFDGFHPERHDIVGAAICLVGTGVIIYAHG